MDMLGKVRRMRMRDSISISAIAMGIKRISLEWHLLKLCRMAIFSDSLLSDYAGLSQ